MQDWNEGHYGTYCCPVCSYRDGAVLEHETALLRIDCSYCEAPLELSLRALDVLALAVRIVDGAVPG